MRRKLRQLPVGCERKLWNRLKNKQLGYKFNRQVSISKYIVDFFCFQLKLVIEIDGATHCTNKEIENDKIRQAYLENLGLTIRRYTNNDIKNNFSEVVYNIQQICEQLISTSSYPSPCLRLSRRRDYRKRLAKFWGSCVFICVLRMWIKIIEKIHIILGKSY